MAVLRASPGLGRQDALDLDFGPAPGQPDLVGQGGQRRSPSSSGSSASPASSRPVEQATVVEEGPLGRGQPGPGVGSSTAAAAGAVPDRDRLGEDQVMLVRLGVAAGSPGIPLR